MVTVNLIRPWWYTCQWFIMIYVQQCSAYLSSYHWNRCQMDPQKPQWGLEHDPMTRWPDDPASSTVMEKNGSRTSMKCSTFGWYSGYLKPSENLKPNKGSSWIQLVLGYVGETSDIIRLFAKGMSETLTDRSWPKTPMWIPADSFNFGVSWCFMVFPKQFNFISSSSTDQWSRMI